MGQPKEINSLFEDVQHKNVYDQLGCALLKAFLNLQHGQGPAHALHCSASNFTGTYNPEREYRISQSNPSQLSTITPEQIAQRTHSTEKRLIGQCALFKRSHIAERTG